MLDLDRRALLLTLDDGFVGRRAFTLLLPLGGPSWSLVREVAGREVSVAVVLQWRRGGPARCPLVGHAAARVKGAAGRPSRHVRDDAGDRVECPEIQIHAGQAGDQPGGVGMTRLAEHPVRDGCLDDAPGIHDRDAVGCLGHQAEIVRDQHHCGLGARAHLGEDGDHLGLDGHVERGGRLVGDQQVGLVGDGDGDHRPLPHTAGELVGVLAIASRRVGHADAGEQLDRALAQLRA